MITRYGATRATVAAVVLVAVAACSDDGGTAPAAAAIVITLSPTSASVARGASTQVVATVSRIGGFSGAITNPTLDGLPAGIAGEWSSITVSPPPDGGIVATVSLQVSTDAPLGNHTVVVRGRGVGVPDVTATFRLTVL